MDGATRSGVALSRCDTGGNTTDMYKKNYITLALTVFLIVFGMVFGISTTLRIHKIEKDSEFIETNCLLAENGNLKSQEMLDTIVLVETHRGGGSGTIISKIETENSKGFKYFVLTNAHVTTPRFFTGITKADAITGKVTVETIDTGCCISVRDKTLQDWRQYGATVTAEDVELDLAILSFNSDEELSTAKIATKRMTDDINVFDTVFSVGCQLGMPPTPTEGIISRIRHGENEGSPWVVYHNTSPIAVGSSGGGMFKEYDGHYYLIGIPFSRAMVHFGIGVPHLAEAISIETAKPLIDSCMVSAP